MKKRSFFSLIALIGLFFASTATSSFGQCQDCNQIPTSYGWTEKRAPAKPGKPGAEVAEKNATPVCGWLIQAGAYSNPVAATGMITVERGGFWRICIPIVFSSEIAARKYRDANYHGKKYTITQAPFSVPAGAPPTPLTFN